MNKQIIEQAIAWNEDLLTYMKDQRATYEDTVGTGDMTEEERKQLYDSMDGDIEMFKAAISALTQQTPLIAEYDEYSKKFKCPSCEEDYEGYHDEETGELKLWFTFCPNCGQRLEISE